MSAPYRRTNEDRRNAVGSFFGALIGNPIAQGVVSPELGVANLARHLANNTTITNVDNAISPQQAEIRNRQEQDRKRRGWEAFQNAFGGTPQPQQLAALGVDTSNPHPPAGLDKAAARGQIPLVGPALQLADQARKSTASPTEGWSYEDKSFAEVAHEAARRKQAGEYVPGQDPAILEQRSNENVVRERGTFGKMRLTDWDTEDIYAVVSRLSNEDYNDLESIQTKDELVDLSSDTTINLLEDAGIVMSPELEESFKAGIGPAMDDWYQQQTAARKSTDMTSYMMGMTQFALTLIDTYGGQGQGTPQVPTSQATIQGTPNEAQFMANYGQGQIPPEFYQGFEAWLESNPNGSYQEYLAAMGAS